MAFKLLFRRERGRKLTPQKILLHTACKIERHPAMRRWQIAPRIRQSIAAPARPRASAEHAASLDRAPIADRTGASGYVRDQQDGDRLGVAIDAPEAQGGAQLRPASNRRPPLVGVTSAGFPALSLSAHQDLP